MKSNLDDLCLSAHGVLSMETLQNTIMNKPVYVTITAIEYLANHGEWKIDIIGRTIPTPLPYITHMIEINGEIIVNTTEWKWIEK